MSIPEHQGQLGAAGRPDASQGPGGATPAAPPAERSGPSQDRLTPPPRQEVNPTQPADARQGPYARQARSWIAPSLVEQHPDVRIAEAIVAQALHAANAPAAPETSGQPAEPAQPEAASAQPAAPSPAEHSPADTAGSRDQQGNRGTASGRGSMAAYVATQKEKLFGPGAGATSRVPEGGAHVPKVPSQAGTGVRTDEASRSGEELHDPVTNTVREAAPSTPRGVVQSSEIPDLRDLPPGIVPKEVLYKGGPAIGSEGDHGQAATRPPETPDQAAEQTQQASTVFAASSTGAVEVQVGESEAVTRRANPSGDVFEGAQRRVAEPARAGTKMAVAEVDPKAAAVERIVQQAFDEANAGGTEDAARAASEPVASPAVAEPATRPSESPVSASDAPSKAGIENPKEAEDQVPQEVIALMAGFGLGPQALEEVMPDMEAIKMRHGVDQEVIKNETQGIETIGGSLERLQEVAIAERARLLHIAGDAKQNHPAIRALNADFLARIRFAPTPEAYNIMYFLYDLTMPGELQVNEADIPPWSAPAVPSAAHAESVAPAGSAPLAESRPSTAEAEVVSDQSDGRARRVRSRILRGRAGRIAAARAEQSEPVAVEAPSVEVTIQEDTVPTVPSRISGRTARPIGTPDRPQKAAPKRRETRLYYGRTRPQTVDDFVANRGLFPHKKTRRENALDSLRYVIDVLSHPTPTGHEKVKDQRTIARLEQDLLVQDPQKREQEVAALLKQMAAAQRGWKDLAEIERAKRYPSVTSQNRGKMMEAFAVGVDAPFTAAFSLGNAEIFRILTTLGEAGGSALAVLGLAYIIWGKRATSPTREAEALENSVKLHVHAESQIQEKRSNLDSLERAKQKKDAGKVQKLEEKARGNPPRPLR